MSLKLQFFPARQGDAIVLRWADRRALIDMGTSQTGPALVAALEAAGETRFDLLVVTHVDTDHIGGVLTGLIKPSLSTLRFKEVWFNGLPQLIGVQDDEDYEHLGPIAGDTFSRWLAGEHWNQSFDGGRVALENDGMKSFDFGDDLCITVLGPKPSRLRELAPVWKEVVDAAKAGRDDPGADEFEALGAGKEPIASDVLPNLEALAAERFKGDPSLTNATSVCLFIEWASRRVLLTGDARADDIIHGLDRLKEARGWDPSKRVHVDLVKVPHHGSRNNVSIDLVSAMECTEWVFSSDGTQFGHPDPESVARILQGRSRSGAVDLKFNVRSVFNAPWGNPDWERKLRYRASYGDLPNGLVVELQSKPGP